MKNEREIISRLLSTIESVIEQDKNGDILSNEELDEYVVAAVLAHKHWGRSCPHVEKVVNDREGYDSYAFMKAGLTDNDYRATYNWQKCFTRKSA